MKWAIVLLSLSPVVFGGDVDLKYAPSPVDNPLRGMVPYLSAVDADRFPHSMRFSYLSMADLSVGENEYDWQPLESLLEECRSHGCQLVLRIYLEYPGKESGVPSWLLRNGVNLTEWTGGEGTINRTPDYEHPSLRAAVTGLITAMGVRFDNDPRLGYLTAGLLGRWGEWHNYPREELFASKEVQREVLDAFEKSFSGTPVLLRYPAGSDHPDKATTAGRAFGYHDDSFAWATLPTERPEDDWFFLTLMKKAGTLDTWKHHPIGGELRPDLWETAFTEKTHARDQGFVRCVEETHATWIMDSGLFDPRFPLPPDRIKNARDQVGRLGYEFHIAKVEWHDNHVQFYVENRGVAPFYRDWEVVVKTENGKRKQRLLQGILPGENAVWTFDLGSPVSESESISIGVPNPMEGGKWLRFANREIDGNWIVIPIPD